MYYKLLLIITIFITGCTQPESKIISNTHLGITPKPKHLSKKEGAFLISKTTTLFYKEASVATVADFFIPVLKKITGLSLEVSTQSEKNNIQLLLDDSITSNAEGYRLTIATDHIIIKANTTQGLFYGMQSLMQLLPSNDIAHTSENIAFAVSALEIKDEPAFLWRGMHLDVSRHFSSVDFIKKQLDVLALFKINKFHWHLTDDQGWRIEIKKYPKLTEIGSKRKNDDGTTYGGFYTQEEIKEVVAYAKERFIDVIPELETPGHAIAALAAYPELACHEGSYKTRELWGVESNVFCPGKPETFAFIENIIDEMAPLFPYEYFHVGGDEVPKEKWKTCPHCQKLIKTESLKDENGLQSYFMAQVEQMLQKRNKKMIGWDEILDGGITPTTNIMSWQGEEGGIKAANEGHDVVMTPIKYTYLNFYQGDHKVEPIAFGGYVPLELVYNYHPIPSEIAEDKRKHILGAQGNVWTEYAETEEEIEYLIYPRIIALAEVTWTPKNEKNFDDFLQRLNHLYPILEQHDINYHIPLPEGPPTNLIKFSDSIKVDFATTHPIKMVYTTDGTKPNANSPIYAAPFTFTTDTELKIATILPHGKMSAIRELYVVSQKPIEAIPINKTVPGLRMKTIKGHFKTIAEIPIEAPSETSIINEISEANTIHHFGYDIKEENLRAVILEGYIDIPEDGSYFFSSSQPQVWIADQLVIDHKAAITKHEEDGSIVLKKGIHKIKIVYLNNVIKGWASDWDTVALKYRKTTDPEYQMVTKEMLFH